MKKKFVRTISGRSVNDLRMEAVLSGDIRADDFGISAETLQYQADDAMAAGYQQLSENLRRAAELTRLSNKDIFVIYNALRPGRSTFRQLNKLAERLASERAPLTAKLVREAASIYAKRGILRYQKQGSSDPDVDQKEQ